MGIEAYKIDEYINRVCSHVKYKKAHNEIKEELFDHLQEKIEGLMENGIIEEEAVKESILQMGDAEIIGKQLNESHKAVPEISIILLTVVLSLIGLLSIYFIATRGIDLNIDRVYRTIFYNVLGCCIMTALYFFNYKTLERYSKIIYTIISLILFFQCIVCPEINGTKRWINLGFLSMDITEMSLFLYAITLPKMLQDLEWDSIKHIAYLFFIAFIPLGLYVLLNTMMCLIIYLVLFITLMILVKAKLRYILIMIFTVLGGTITFIASREYHIKRLMVFLHPESDPNGAGYINSQISLVLKSVGLYGHGLNSPPRTIPEIQNDFVLTYIIYAFGWIGGIVVISLAFIFIIRLFMAAKKIRDSFGSLVIQGFLCIFALKFIWNILMILGFMPIVSVSLPFISYGGSGLVVQMAAVGLILSIYKAKNLSNTSSISIKS
ncbi:FtsW/RodA/SpoVE family cell cycle protein [Clostridium sp. PL3]|uniref:FtsW/RodA/SpoVE family cell cycle protein n=1 Tax=Clostridium thailandense TaxID=2794346 RepID=A0A949WPU2_9CLOT|nr:FtsW/RodA/SpoVE family cell cycle protein [Clostridium thailandense]MBV7271790.1 FtsW/RodA/SpoVE family cell cycle protein [Clostridium thailandense]